MRKLETESLSKAKLVYQGVFGFIYDFPKYGTQPIWKYVNSDNQHLYTNNSKEVGVIIDGKIGKNNWKSEGVLGYAYKISQTQILVNRPDIMVP